MNTQFLPTIKLIIAGGWRQRFLLVMPFLIMLPVCALWALYGPRTYVSKSLMLLQEAGAANPFARDAAGPARIQDRFAGLQALLKSERVLMNVYKDVSGEQSGATRDAAVWMREFSEQLKLELIGSDFLEFQLKGSSPKGLGKRLESVTSRFLDALLPEQNALVASQVLLEKRKEELDASERALATFRQRLVERVPQGLTGTLNRLNEARSALQAKEAQLNQISTDIAQKRARLPAATARVEQEIAQTRAQLVSLEKLGVESKAQVTQVQGRLSELLVIKDLEASRTAFEAEARELARQAEGLARTVRQNQPLAEQLAQLEREAAEAKEAFDSYTVRYQRASATRTSGILNAPERIKLIDAPRDPDFPTASATKFAMIGLLMSLLLGVGLAIGAELLSPRMRSSEEAMDATGLPLIASLP